MSKDLWLKRIRNYVGLLGMVLPWLALFSAGIVDPHPSVKWWYSISATYYQSLALVGVLTAASIVLMTYDGYSFIDNVVTTVSGVFGLGIVLFPCSVDWIDGKVGFFQIPMHYSNKIHCACAAAFFVLLAFNSFFLFTKTDNPFGMTDKKKLRNKIYRICGIGMLVFMVWQAITSQVSFFKGYWTMINEIFLLQFFGISWLVKGGAFKFLNDREMKPV